MVFSVLDILRVGPKFWSNQSKVLTPSISSIRRRRDVYEPLYAYHGLWTLSLYYSSNSSSIKIYKQNQENLSWYDSLCLYPISVRILLKYKLGFILSVKSPDNFPNLLIVDISRIFLQTGLNSRSRKIYS